MSARDALKAASRASHDRVDAAFGYDLANPVAYAAFLSRQAAALFPVEQALEEAGADRLIEDWEEHRRTPLLAADLAKLELPMPMPINPPLYAREAMVVGGLYVLEGSRLGGAVLRRRVAPGLPSTFLGARQTPGRWTRFVASLDELLYSPQRLDAAVAAALDTFACYEQAAKQAEHS